jgi:hypothetical protein
MLQAVSIKRFCSSTLAKPRSGPPHSRRATERLQRKPRASASSLIVPSIALRCRIRFLNCGLCWSRRRCCKARDTDRRRWCDETVRRARTASASDRRDNGNPTPGETNFLTLSFFDPAGCSKDRSDSEHFAWRYGSRYAALRCNGNSLQDTYHRVLSTIRICRWRVFPPVTRDFPSLRLPRSLGNRIQVVDLYDESLICLLRYREIQKAGIKFL